MAVSEEFLSELDDLSISDWLRLQIVVDNRVAELKTEAKNFPSSRWAVLNETAAKANNRTQYLKAKANGKVIFGKKTGVQAK